MVQSKGINLTLEPLQPKDLLHRDLLKQFFCTEDALLFNHRILDTNEIDTFIDNAEKANDNIPHLLIIHLDSVPIGFTGINKYYKKDSHATISIGILPPYRLKGIGKASLRGLVNLLKGTIKPDVLVIETAPDNYSMQMLAISCGFDFHNIIIRKDDDKELYCFKHYANSTYVKRVPPTDNEGTGIISPKS